MPIVFAQENYNYQKYEAKVKQIYQIHGEWFPTGTARSSDKGLMKCAAFAASFLSKTGKFSTMSS
jgi:hypothetical protein